MSLWILAIPLTTAIVSQTPPIDDATADNQEFVELQAAATRYAITVGSSARPAMLNETPLLNFTNPARNQERGSVFVWQLDDRPVAIGQLFRYTNTKQIRATKHAFHSLSSERLRMTDGDAVVWSPQGPGVDWKWIADAPVPVESANGRLLQMRQLARRFRVTLTNPKQESTELRLTPRPLWEYAAPTQEVIQGAFFSFVVATDPEAILLLEASDEGGQRRYRFGFARFHFYQLVATDGDHEVWRVDYDPSQLNNPAGAAMTMSKTYNSFMPK